MQFLGGRAVYLLDSLGRSDDFGNTDHKLTVSLAHVCADLSNKRVGESKLRHGKTGHSKLTDTDKADTKLADAKHSAAKLPDGDNTFCNDRNPVGAVLE